MKLSNILIAIPVIAGMVTALLGIIITLIMVTKEVHNQGIFSQVTVFLLVSLISGMLLRLK
jgi:predicted Co/Zn/Cd cation transporter (cation efflux family)